LQSLYQQHYLNNVYLNQYYGNNNDNDNYNFPQNQFETTNENFTFKNDENFDENVHEPYSKMNSSINSDGK